jgi:DNA-binding transcriptional LysR family regulator
MDKMRRFDLDLLHMLVVVADAGSLSAAAPRLCRSQSAVSEQIRKLEEACGLALLVRGKSGARLTPAGERLRNHAHKLLALNDFAYRDMRGTQLAGDLHLAVTDYFRPTAIADILKRLRGRYPHLRLHVSMRKSALIERDAEGGDFDIGLSMRVLGREDPGDADDRASGRIPLRRESMIWVADSSFDMEGETELPLIVLPETCSLRQLIVRTLERNHVPYTIAHSASGVGGLQFALAAGLGISCLNTSSIPAGMGRFDGGDHIELPALPDVEFGLVPPRPGESPLVSEVREILAQELA